MNIDLKLTVYRMIKNYIYLRLIRFVINRYNKWETSYNNDLKSNKESPLPGDIIPYNKAVNAITALKLRGGSSNFPIIIAFYKIIYIIKKYIIKFFPRPFMKFLTAYNALKEKYPRFKYIEDIIVLSLSIATASITIKSKNKEYVLTYDLFTDSNVVDFANVAADLGVNTEICGYGSSIMFEALLSREISDSHKVICFGHWLKELILAENSGEKQGLLLCLIAILVFFFSKNYGLFLDLLRYLREAVKRGEISESFLKLIIRRLLKAGVKVPARYVKI